MIILDSSTKLQAVFAGAITSVNPKVIVSYGEETATTKTFGLTTIATNGTTAVDILDAPSSSTWRLVKSLQLNNTDTAAVTVTIRTNISAAVATIFKVSLAVGYTLCYEDRMGWYVTDSYGQMSQTSPVNSYRFIKTTTLTSGTRYFPSENCTAIEIEMWGAGGGGGGVTGAASNGAAAGGGAAGGYLQKFLTVISTNAITYTIGASGGQGANTGGTGGLGGDSTFVYNGTTYTAKGGNGGVGMTTGNTVLVALGGVGVIPTNGDINILGESGQHGIRLNGTIIVSGNGGVPTAIVGANNRGLITSAAGSTPSTGGGGGSGAGAVGNTNSAGGFGGAGLIIIHEYL